MKGVAFGRVALWVLVVFLAVMAFWFGMQRLRADPTVLQNYDVPPEIAGEVRTALAGALSQGDVMPPLGRATLMPNGRLVVTAPSSVQKGVAEVIRDISRNKPAPTPTIGFDVWVVSGTPGGNTPGETLPEIEPALAAIRKTQGSLNFELMEKLSTVARSGQDWSNIGGAVWQMRVHASLRKSADNRPVVAAQMVISGDMVSAGGMRSNISLNTQSEMRPGELLVIGQSALGQPGSPKTGKQVYYIVRATL